MLYSFMRKFVLSKFYFSSFDEMKKKKCSNIRVNQTLLHYRLMAIITKRFIQLKITILRLRIVGFLRCDAVLFHFRLINNFY